MSLDISLNAVRKTCVYDANITHNLNGMAEEAGFYKHLWRPEEIGVTLASELIEPLERGIQDMKERPEHYQTFDAKNGWGTYKDFLPWLEKLLAACKENPDAEIEVSR